MRKTRQILLFLTVVLLFITALPFAVMADETEETEQLPAQASVRAHQAKANRMKVKTPDPEDLEEPEGDDPEDPEEMSERALFVAERNAQAWAWGIPPGHVNLFDKLSALTEQTREDVYTWFTNPDAPMKIRDLAKAIKEARQAAMGDEAIVGEQKT